VIGAGITASLQMLIRIAREVVRDRCLVAENLSLTWMHEPGSASIPARIF
jgi:hypothetical protein